MAQATHTIDIETTGENLAAQLQAWRDALHSSHRGEERPAYVVAGMLWVKEVSGTLWEVYFAGNESDGSADGQLAIYDPTTGELAINGNGLVPADRTVSAGTGLSGGGDLSANRTLSLNLNSANSWVGAQTVADNSLSIVSSAVAWDVSAKQKTKLTLTESPTMSAPTGMVANGEYALTLIQNATGGWQPAWNAAFKGMGNLDLDLAPNARTRLTFESDGTNMYLTGCLSGIGA